MANCNDDKVSRGIIEGARIRGIRYGDNVINGKGDTSKPMLWNIHSIEPTMFYELLVNNADITFNKVMKLIGKSEPASKFKKSYDSLMDLRMKEEQNFLVKSLPIQNEGESDTDYKRRLGVTIRARGVAMHHIFKSYESEKNVQDKLDLKDTDLDALITHETRKVSTIEMYSAIGKELSNAIGIKASMDAISNKEYYAEVGRLAVLSLSHTDAIVIHENDYYMNNNYKDAMAKNYGGKEAILKGDSISINLNNIVGSGDANTEARAAMNEAFETGDLKYIEKHSNTLMSTITGAKTVSILTTQSNLLAPHIGKNITSPFTTKELGLQKNSKTIEQINKTITTLANQKSELNPVINTFFKVLYQSMKKIQKDGDPAADEERTMKQVYANANIKESVVSAIFGSFKLTTPDNFRSDMGKSISKQNPMFNLINMYGDFINDDMTSKKFMHEINMYRTTRIEYRATMLNEQSDKFFARAMTTGGKYLLKTEGLVYNHFINGITDEFQASKTDLYASMQKEGLDPVIDALIKSYENAFVNIEGKSDRQIFELQKKWLSQMTTGYANTGNKNKISDSLKYGSVWDLLDVMGAIHAVRTQNNGVIETTFRTKPDATASGIVLSLLQALGKDSRGGIDDVHEMLKNLGITKDKDNIKYEDAYKILTEAVKIASTEDVDGDTETYAYMQKLERLGIFKNIREIVKPTTIVTNYAAGKAATISDSSKELTDIVIEHLLSNEVSKESLLEIKSMVQSGNSELYNKLPRNIKAENLAKIPGINEAIKSHFAKKGGLTEKLREHLDYALNPLFEEYRGRISKIYKKVLKLRKDDKLNNTADSNNVPLAIIPYNVWHYLIEDSKDKGLTKGTSEYRKWYREMLDLYAMPLSSKYPVIADTKTGKKVVIQKEQHNELTAIVNAIHGIDSGIFFIAHERTIKEIEVLLADEKNKLSIFDRTRYTEALEQASGMIHDANNGNPYYNKIYQKHYRALTFEASIEYDIEEQLALLYDMAANEVGSDTEDSAKNLKTVLANKKSKAKIIKETMDTVNPGLFGFNAEIDEVKKPTSPEPKPIKKEPRIKKESVITESKMDAYLGEFDMDETKKKSSKHGIASESQQTLLRESKTLNAYDLTRYAKDSKIIRNYLTAVKRAEGVLSSKQYMYDNNSGTYYDHDDSQIYIEKKYLNPRLANIVNVIEHEIIHANTTIFMRTNPNDPNVVKTNEIWKYLNKNVEFKSFLSDQFIKYNNKRSSVLNNVSIAKRLFYAVRDAEEFTAVMLSEPDVYNAMIESLEADKSTEIGFIANFKRVIEYLKTKIEAAIGFKPTDIKSILEAVNQSGQDFIVDRADAIKIVQKKKALSKKSYLEPKKNPRTSKKKSPLKERLKIEQPNKPGMAEEEMEGIIMTPTNMINNYAKDITENLVGQGLDFSEGAVQEGHEYLMDNFEVYKDNFNRTNDYWNSAQWLQSMKGYLNKMRFGMTNMVTMNQMATLQEQASQNRKSTEDKRIAHLNHLMTKLTDDQKKDILEVTAIAPIFHLINDDGDMNSLVNGDKTIKVMIKDYEQKLDKNTREKVQRLAALLARTEQPRINKSYYNIESMKLTATEISSAQRLTALYTMQYAENAQETLKLLKDNPELAKTIFVQSHALKKINDEVYKMTGDRTNYKENLIYEQFKIPKEFKIVDQGDLMRETYKLSNGWSILREPSGKNYGIVVRNIEERTFQPGTGTSLHYQSSDVYVPNDKRISNAHNVLSVGINRYGEKKSGKDTTMHKLVLTKEESAKLNPIQNPADALVRAYGRMIEIKDTQAIRDELILGTMIQNINKPKEITKFNEDLKTMEVRNRPIFIYAPDVDSPQKIIQSNKQIGIHYKIAENISNISGIKDRITFVRKDASDTLLGYQDPVIFENTPELRKAAYVLRQLVKLTKMHWVITNGVKIFFDGSSNVAILAAYGVPFTSMPAHFAKTAKELKSLQDLRLDLLDAELAKYGGDESAQKTVDKITKKIQKHPMALMLNSGMLQSMSTEVMSKDESVISGLQNDIESILNKFLKKKGIDGKLVENNFADGIRAMASAGWNIEDLLIWAGESVENFDHMKGLGEGLKESGGRLKRKKSSEDVSKYISEYIASPDSELVRMGSALVQITDILPRKMLLDYYLAQGMDQDLAVSKAIDAFIDYKVNMPKELKVLSDYGILLFPSFWMRIQKVIISTVKASPVTTPAALVLTQSLDMHFETIYGSNLFNKLEMNPFNTPPIGPETFLPLDLFGF